MQFLCLAVVVILRGVNFTEFFMKIGNTKGFTKYSTHFLFIIAAFVKNANFIAILEGVTHYDITHK